MTLQERQDAQAERIGKMRSINDSATGGNLTEDQQRSYDGIEAEYEAEEKAIQADASATQRQERLAAHEANQARRLTLPGNTIPSGRGTDTAGTETGLDFAGAMRGWAAGRAARPEDAAAARRLGIDMDGGDLTLRLLPEQPRNREEARAYSRSMNGLQGSAGAFTVAPVFAENFEMARLGYDTMRNLAEVMRTDSGAPMTWPTSNDTTNEGRWLAVNQTMTNTDLTVGGKVWTAHTISSDSVLVDRGLLQDSSFNMPNVIAKALGERMGRAMGRAHAVGTGVGQPYGIVNASTLGKTASSSTAVTFDEIMDLVGSVDSAYAPNSVFMMNRLIKMAIRKLKDSQNRYLWEPSTIVGEPDSILGYPVYENSYMASTLATTNKIILFGDMSYYKIRDVSTVTIQRLVEKYAENNQDAFLAVTRTDGNLLDAGTNPVKHLKLA